MTPHALQGLHWQPPGIAQADNCTCQLVLTCWFAASEFLPPMQAARTNAHDMNLCINLQQEAFTFRGLKIC